MNAPRLTAFLPLAIALSLTVSCGPPPVGAASIYDPDAAAGGDFFAVPWPADSRLVVGTDGKKHVDLKGFNNPGFAIGQYLAALAAEPLDGFGTQSAIYFRFSAPLDPTSLPADATASMASTASVFVVDTTPTSPTYGQRHPMRARFVPVGGNYIGDNYLALLPQGGFPLREGTTYTAVVTDGVRAADKGTLRRSARFEPKLDDKVGVATERVVVATTFTTQHTTPIMLALRDAVYAQSTAPVVADLVYIGPDKTMTFDQYEGTYQSPNFQEGDPPYLTHGGHIHFGSDGKPEVTRTETLRFALTVPRFNMPTDGWPIILYAHGTGGDFHSFINDGSALSAANIDDGKGAIISRMAMIGIDMVNHGPRDPTMSDEDFTFVNLNNIIAARDNPKQGALDNFQLLRLVEGINEAQAPMTGNPLRFDKKHLYFKGHSHGGLTGPLFLAFEPKIKAAVLSGAGGGLIFALLNKKEPTDIPAVVGAIVGEDVDETHPLLNMMQVYLESTDPANYGKYAFREPPTGMAPKSVFHSIGLVDYYAPVPGLKAMALALGAQPANPMLDPIEGLSLTSFDFGDPPIQLNVAGGMATAVTLEYQVPLDNAGRQKYDGHYVIFRNATARLQSNAFFGTHYKTGTATLIAP